MSDQAQQGEAILAVKYGKLEMPDGITYDAETATNTFARFVAEPFERGFGHTVGNAMRRTMLTAIEAPSIISVRMQGVSHEYMAVEGITEDMTDIILNLKGALIRRLPTGEKESCRQQRIVTTMIKVTQEDLDNAGGMVSITLGDVCKDPLYEIINPELHLFNVTQPMERQFDIRVTTGRGYVPSERLDINDKVVDEIAVDAPFSPVRRVVYWVENTRVGRDTEFDRLCMEVTTDGRITPQEAVAFATQIVITHFQAFESMRKVELVFDEGGMEAENNYDELMDKLALRIDEIELSVRSTNCLSSANINTIGELVLVPERRMLEFRNFGKKSLDEIKATLTRMGLSLGMDLGPMGLTEENIREKIVVYLEERKARALPIGETADN